MKPNDYTKANGINQITDGICAVLGPMFGALLVSIFGIASVFFANSVSFFLSGILTFFINTDLRLGQTRVKRNLHNEMMEGIYYIKNQVQIKMVFIIIISIHFIFGCLMVALPFIAKSFHGDAVKNIGYIEMLFGGGIIAGSLIAGRLKQQDSNQRKLVLTLLMLGLMYIGISVALYNNTRII